MSYTTMGAAFAIGLFLLMLLCLELGKWLGERRLKVEGEKPHSSATVAEGAVLGLMGLLIAFTFSGANDRFDARREQIIEEANKIETAYLRIDLAPASYQPALRESFKRYVDSRILTYQKIPDIEAALAEWKNSIQIQKDIWTKAVDATINLTNDSPAQLLIPAINDMIDIAKTRVALTRMHPPRVIFFLLIGLALLSSFLSGFSMAGSKVRSSLHIIGYAAITAIIIYIIINMEFPLLGTIRFENFEHLFAEVRNQMN